MPKRYKDPLKESDKLNHFLNRYLEPDGMFMIRVIGNNSSDFVATDLIHELWKKHYSKYSNVQNIIIKKKWNINEKQDENGNEILTHHGHGRKKVDYDEDDGNENENEPSELSINLNNIPNYDNIDQSYNVSSGAFPSKSIEHFSNRKQPRVMQDDEECTFIKTDVVNENRNQLLNKRRENSSSTKV